MNPLDQLLRDAMTEHTDAVPHLRPGSARRALVTARRRRTATMAAAGTATLAATAGVGAIVITQQPATSTAGTYGGPGGAHADTATQPVASKPAPDASAAPKTATATATAAGGATATAAGPAAGTATASAAVTPVSGSTAPVPKPTGPAPAELAAVTMPDAIAGTSLTLMSTNTVYEDRNGAMVWTKYFVYGKSGATVVGVMVVDGSDVPFWNSSQSPSPAVNAVQMGGHKATDWRSGGDHIVYYSLGKVTVEVTSSLGSTSDMELVGNAIQGLPQ